MRLSGDRILLLVHTSKGLAPTKKGKDGSYMRDSSRALGKLPGISVPANITLA